MAERLPLTMPMALHQTCRLRAIERRHRDELARIDDMQAAIIRACLTEWPTVDGASPGVDIDAAHRTANAHAQAAGSASPGSQTSDVAGLGLGNASA